MTNIIDFLQDQPNVYITFAVILGAVIGSFLNVVIHRLPIMLKKSWRHDCQVFLSDEDPSFTAPKVDTDKPTFNLLRPNSHCPHCHRPVRFFENIPVFSFLLLRGKCAGCNAAISWRYPAVELLTAILSGYVASQFGVTLACLSVLIFIYALIVLVGIDLAEQLLPDNITLPLLWLGLFVNIFGYFADLRDAVFGAIFGYLILWSVATLFKLVTKREGMGHGDFKLLACLGAWLGWQMLPFIILCSSLLGCVGGAVLMMIKRQQKSQPFPFGPYLAIAGVLALFYGPLIMSAYFYQLSA